MSDIEDDLLALAGADSGSESGSDTSDVPLQRTGKRLPSDKEDEDDYDPDNLDAEPKEEDELQNPYPLEGKYKDEQDRAELLAMGEMEREQTLFERSQEMDRYNEKAYLQQRLKQLREPTRSLTRKVAPSGAKLLKLDKLSELRKQRERKRQKKEDDYEQEDEEEEEEEEEEYEEDVVWGSGKSKYKPRSYERCTLADLNRISVGRSFLSKYLYYRHFSEVVVNTFGKVNVGLDRRTRKPMYRLVQIEEVISRPQKTYKVGDLKLDIFLVVSQNRTQTKEFPVTVFSDSAITQEEMDRYAEELAKNNENVPYVADAKEKAEELHRLMGAGLSNEDIDEMVSRKQKMGGLRLIDAVYQKSQVLDELRVAQQEQDTAKVQLLRARLAELEAVLETDHERALQSKFSMAAVNERNRKLNQTNVRRAELELMRRTETLDGDPFLRLKTNTRMFYQDLVNAENQRALQDARANYDLMIAEKNEQEAQIASLTYRVLGCFDELVASVNVEIAL